MSKPYEALNLNQLSVHAAANPIKYLVSGLIPVGSVNLLGGKPKSGKSTLARQLAACISTGDDFLGRSTTTTDTEVRPETLYFANEEIGAHVAEHFSRLGVSRAEDGVHVVLQQPHGPDFVDRLDATLEMYPQVKLVIIDPLVHFLAGIDIDSYGQVSPAMARMNVLAAKRNIAILAVHHTKKRATEQAGDGMLGSTSLIASVCTTLFLEGEFGSVRRIKSSQRYGPRIEYSELSFDEETGSYQLGDSQAEVSAKKDRDTQEERIEKIISFLELADPGTGWTSDQIKDSVKCGNVSLKATIAQLLVDGRIGQTGTGVKGDPQRYTLPKPSVASAISKELGRCA
jgi:archaellum biogenesis ATPase FlaH